MDWIKELSRPTQFGISLGLLLLIIFASIQDWGVLGVVFIVLAYFLGYATAHLRASSEIEALKEDHARVTATQRQKAPSEE